MQKSNTGNYIFSYFIVCQSTVSVKGELLFGVNDRP